MNAQRGHGSFDFLGWVLAAALVLGTALWLFLGGVLVRSWAYAIRVLL